MKRISVVVVSYNTKDLLRRCLTSLDEADEVIVVDNASHDGSPDMVEIEFPTVKLLRNDRNLGFGTANNRGMEVATGELVLLLNSDACAFPNSIARLAEVFNDPTVVAAGGGLVSEPTLGAPVAPDPLPNPPPASGGGDRTDADQTPPPPAAVNQAPRPARNQAPPAAGNQSSPPPLAGGGLGRGSGSLQPEMESRVEGLQLSAANRLTLWAVVCEQTYLEKLFPHSRLLSPYWIRNASTTREVWQVMGACLMMRPVEKFDERFFLYCEDTELCARLHRHGRILYVPEARFRHELGASSTGNRWLAVARYNRGKELYFRIHYGSVAAFACWLVDRVGALLRLVLWALATLITLGAVRSFRRRASLFARVLFAPIFGPD